MPDELLPFTQEFASALDIIEKAKRLALRAVNAEMIQMYWDIGEYVSRQVKSGGWGKSVVKEFSAFLQAHYPASKGFSPQNIWRMKQFYETYSGNEKLSPLVREVSWTNNLLLLSSCKSDESREFYLRLCIQYHYSKRELERQLDSMLYERSLLSDSKNQGLTVDNAGLSSLRDSYVFEFLDLPYEYRERDLRKAIVSNLRDFILEFGKDFSFMGEEYRVQVGNTDFFIDLLFYNRALSCLIAVELKVGRFKPEHIGQINFYLEALDRDVRKANENPSVGLILCASKDDAVVEYALSRSMSPMMVAEYTLQLPDKKLLREKLRELTELALDAEEEDREE